MNDQAKRMLKAKTPGEAGWLILEWLNVEHPNEAETGSLFTEAVDLLNATKRALFEMENNTGASKEAPASSKNAKKEVATK